MSQASWPQAPGADELARAVCAVLSAGGALSRRLPGFNAREGQQALAASIATAIAGRSALVAEAGTGTGKTFAYLVPLLMSGARALISTGTRQLQDQLHGRDLPAVRAALGLDVRTALLKGRANYVCHHHLERQMTDGRFPDPATPAKLVRIHRFAAASETGDRADCDDLAEDDPAWAWATSTRDNCLGQECPDIKRCFVFKARRDAMAADVVVVNHHLFCADLALRDESMAELLPNVEAVVFDEAHQLPDAATEFFGEAVSTRQLIDLARDVVRAGLVEARDGADWRSLSDRLERASRELRLALEDPAPAGMARGPSGRTGAARAAVTRRWSADQLRARPVLDEAVDAVSADLVSISAIVAANAGRGPELDRCGLRATELLERLQRWMAALGAPPGAAVGAGRLIEADDEQASDGNTGAAVEDDPAVVWAESSGPHASLRRTPLSVAGTFGRHRAGSPRAWVFLSATLSMGQDFSHFVEALGLQDARCERWESPFDFSNQAALWVPRGIGAASAPGFAAALSSAVWPLIRANQGRAFVLCTSLRSMRDMAQSLRDRNAADDAGLSFLVQGEASRAALLEQFRQGVGAVLVGSAGFWEGVDVVGDALSLVIIDKLPFAPPDDPVVAARADALRRAGRDPFSHSQLPQAALALKQGAGRLIRSESDRGVLVIGDERLESKGYGRRLTASLPPFKRVATAQEAMAWLPVGRSD